MAAVLAIGERAVLSPLSLAALLGTWRYRVPVPDVLVPRRHRPVKGIDVHTCRRLDPRDVTVYRGIPVTTVARMLVDLTDVLIAEELANVIHEADFRGSAGVKSRLERAFLSLSDRILRAAGYTVLRVTEDQLEHDPTGVLARLRAGT